MEVLRLSIQTVQIIIKIFHLLLSIKVGEIFLGQTNQETPLESYGLLSFGLMAIKISMGKATTGTANNGYQEIGSTTMNSIRLSTCL